MNKAKEAQQQVFEAISHIEGLNREFLSKILRGELDDNMIHRYRRALDRLERWVVLWKIRRDPRKLATMPDRKGEAE